MYLESEIIQRQLNLVSGRDIDTSELLEIPKLEDIIRKQKVSIAAELYSKRNQFNLDSFLEMLARMLNVSKIEIEYYYFISRQFDFTREISEKKRAFVTFIGDVQNVNHTYNPCHTSAIQMEIERLLRENIDFLFLCSEDDTFIADMVKTPNEIILPYGNSIKYSKGNRSSDFEKVLRLATDTANTLDFPVTLKLRP